MDFPLLVGCNDTGCRFIIRYVMAIGVKEDYQENYITGWIKIFRSIKSHWLWTKNKPLSNFEAWLVVLLEVNHSDVKINIGYDVFECNRGESLNSLETWAKLFNWNKSRVRRFFMLLQKDNMIRTNNVLKTTHLTVCNYDTYQSMRNASETQVKRKRNASDTKQEYKNEKNDNKYTHKQFYSDQLKESNNDKKYQLFINWLYGDNIFKRPLNKVLDMAEQVSWNQFPALVKINEDTGIKIKTLLEELEDWLMENPRKKNKTIVGTLRTFANNKKK